ncbi:hypothetical protein, partial [Mesorhizobium sp. M0674]|uniref:hypothetical protein n=1 Tax=Mesorhizobium sp. M0674 TaxID=2956983 RepID=UPI003336A5DB
LTRQTSLDDRELERQLTDERFLEADRPDTAPKLPDRFAGHLSRKVAFSLPGSRHFLQGASKGWIG